MIGGRTQAGYFVSLAFIGARKEGQEIKALTVREILDEQIARKLA